MKAALLVNNLLEGENPIFQETMQRATAEFLADTRNRAFGGVRPDNRPMKDAYDINCGMCEEWAERVSEIYRKFTGSDDVEVVDAGNLTGDADDTLECGHVFIHFGNKFYDAECPQGVRKFWQLPLFIKNGWKDKVKPMPEIEVRKLMGEAQEDVDDPNPLVKKLTEANDGELERIRRRIAKIKADREGQSAEIAKIDDPDAFIKGEVARRSVPIKKLEVWGKRWYRRGPGGVYCKAYIYINDNLVHVTPEQYGYGDHYLTLAEDWLERNGYIDREQSGEPLWRIAQKMGFQLLYHVTDVKRERDL